MFAALKYRHRDTLTGLLDQKLQIWLRSFLKPDGNIELCHYVYNNRDHNYIKKLTRRAKREEKRTGPQSKRSSFASVKHYLGRLAHHVRASKELVDDAGHLSQLFESYNVCAVEPLSSVPPPTSDNHTTLDGILNRMLKNNHERPEIENSLFLMDTKFGIFGQFMKQYKDCEPQVHAEVQVLEYFYKMKLSFVENDRYIACSKPACLCCKMYFKYHPARMVKPESHNKVWVNWGPPLVKQYSKDDPESRQQLDILNKMTENIRSKAIAQILGHASPARWHPDSWTGITENQRSDFSSSDFSDNELGDVEVTLSTEQQIARNNSLSTTETPNQYENEFLDGDSGSYTGGVSIFV